MEEAMRRQKLPAIDSIEALAKFWDSHDLTSFEEDLEEVGEPVFIRRTGTSLTIDLQPSEAQELQRIARSKHLAETSVARQWILERINECSRALPPAAQKTRR